MKWEKPIIEDIFVTDDIDWEIFDINRTLENGMEILKYWRNQKKLLKKLLHDLIISKKE